MISACSTPSSQLGSGKCNSDPLSNFIPFLRRIACIGLVCPSVCFLLCFAAEPSLQAQGMHVGDDTMTPIPGAGHDYIHAMAETVNPANGTVNLKFELPVPTGRGMTMPFALTYGSGTAQHMEMNPAAVSGTVAYSPGTMEFMQGPPYRPGETILGDGWDDTVPYLSYSAGLYAPTSSSAPTFTGVGANCAWVDNFVFRDADGGLHSLNMAAQGTAPSGVYTSGVCSGASTPSNPYVNGGDGQVYASLNCNPNALCTFPEVYVTDMDGTVYTFQIWNVGQPTVQANAPNSPLQIEDRNGNVINTGGSFPFSFVDTAGREEVAQANTSAGTLPTSVNVSGITYQITYSPTSTPAPAFTVPSQQMLSNGNYCPFEAGPGPDQYPSPNGNVRSIGLPNGQQYTFYYGADNPDPSLANPYGLISEIIYPDGGWVKYNWGVSSTFSEVAVFANTIEETGHSNATGCVFEYNTPVVVKRQVGMGSTTWQTQFFTYSTTWDTTTNFDFLFDWTQKTTSVYTYDNLLNKTALTQYTYSPITLPTPIYTSSPAIAQYAAVESSVIDYDWGSGPITSGITGGLLQTITESWASPSQLAKKTIALSNGSTSQIVNNYSVPPNINLTASNGPANFLAFQLTETDEYDFGQTKPSRKSLTSYQAFPSVNMGDIMDEPCKKVTTDGNGNWFAETDYYYDGATGSTPCAAETAGSATSPVSNLPSGTHDDPTTCPFCIGLFSSSSTTPRGNLTKQIRLLLQGGTGPTTTYTYDETGQPVKMTDPNINQTIYSFSDNPIGGNVSGNSNAYLTQVTDALGNNSHYSYNYSLGYLASAADPNQYAAGLATTYKYNTPPAGCAYSDGLDRLSEIDYPDGGKTTYCYNDSVPSITTTKLQTPNPTVTSVSIMDGVGRVIQTQTSEPAGGDVVSVTYDGVGHVYTTTNPFLSSLQPSSTLVSAPSGTPATTYYYDALSRPIETQEQDGNKLQWCYDGAVSTPAVQNCVPLVSSNTTPGSITGTWVDSTDENGNHWQRASDSFGRLTQMAEPNGVSRSPSMLTIYNYDALNNLLSVNQRGNGTTDVPRGRTFNYDSLSRLLCASNPENASEVCPSTYAGYVAGTTGYIYDADGNVTSKTDARAVTTNYQYDALNQVLSKTYLNDPSNTPSSCYQYGTSTSGNTVERLIDEWTQKASAGSCPSSVPSSGSYLTAKLNLTYDPMGRLASAQQQQCIGSTCSAPSPYSLAMIYDLAGNQDSLTNSVGANGSGLTLNYSYDAASRPCLATSSWTSGFSPNLFQTNASTSTPGYWPFGGLQNWFLGSSSNTALTSCSTPSSTINVQQQFDSRLRLTSFSSSGQVP